ncbi:MAG: TonB-dependent receptor [Methylococcales bacterium]|nr:TonB-dependent receptor [Methylococcales bacterium]
MKHKPLLFLTCYLFSTATLAVQAITDLDTMTVSDKPLTAPSFNTEPVSKNEFYQLELVERDLNNLEQVSQQIANLHLTNDGVGSYGQKISVRGLSNTALFSAPAVVIYVDDVPYSSSMAAMGRLVAIDSLDVYRSSQPARFGKNAYAGAIDIKTKQPVNELHAGVALELANYNQHQVTANSSGALIKDQLYFNLSGEFQQRDGFLYNSYLNTTPDNQTNFSGRAALKWTPNKAWDVRFTANKEHYNYGSARFSRLDSPDRYTTRSEAAEQLKQQSNSEAIRIAYNTDNYELLSVSNRQSWQMNPRVTDLNLTPTQYTRTQNATETAWTQEVRLRPKDQHTDWLWHTGLFYTNIDRHSVTDTTLLGNNNHIEQKKRDTDNYALFGKLVYQGVKTVKPYMDMRVDYVRNVINANTVLSNGKKLPYDQNQGSVFVSPQVGVDVTLSDNALLYVGTGLSYKPSGYTIANIIDNLSHYKQERLWHNELGIKSHWLDERLKLNVAGFYYAIENYQLERFFTQTDYAIVNAPKAHSVGFEVETQAQLMENLSLDGNFGYTHTQFDEYRDPITNINYAGKLAPFVPELTGLLALQYKHPRGYFARAEGVWTGRTFFDETNAAIMRQDAYALANLRVGYEQKNYSVYLFAKNITDTRYYTFKTDNIRGTPSDPRMVGVRLAVNF